MRGRNYTAITIIILLILQSLVFITFIPFDIKSDTIPETSATWIYESVGQVNCVAISAYGDYIVVGTSDGYVILFLRGSNIPKNALDLGINIEGITINDEGSIVYAYSGRILYRINITLDQKLISSWSKDVLTDFGDNNEYIYEIAISSSGNYIIIGGYGETDYGYTECQYILLNSEGKIILDEYLSEGLRETRRFEVDISSNSNNIVVGQYGGNSFVRLYSNENLTPIIDYNIGSYVNDVAISDNGKYFVAGADKVYYFKNDSSIPLWTKSFSGKINYVKISSDGLYVTAVSGSNILYFNQTEVFWTIDTGSIINSFTKSKKENYIGFLADGFVFGKIGDNMIEFRRELLSHIHGASISQYGLYYVVGTNNEVHFYQIDKKCDLIPIEIIISDDNPKLSEKINITAKIKNEGNLKSTSTSIRFYLNDTIFSEKYLKPLNSSEDVDVDTDFECIKSEFQIVKVIVDPFNNIFEANNYNNILTTSLYVKPQQTINMSDNPVQRQIIELGELNCVSIDGTGQYFLTSGNDNFLYFFNKNLTSAIWSKQYYNPIETITHAKSNNLNVFNIDRWIFYNSNYFENELWSEDVLTDFVDNTEYIHEIAISSDGGYLIVGGYGDAIYGDADYQYLLLNSEGKIILDESLSEGYRETRWFEVDISSNGNYYVVGQHGGNGFVRFYSIISSTPIIDYDTGSFVNDVAISSDGEYSVGGSDKIYFFDKDTVTPKWNMDLGNYVSNVAISSDGSEIAAVSGNILYFIDTTNNGNEIWNYNVYSNINHMKMSENGEYIVLASGTELLIFSTTEDGDTSSKNIYDPLWSYNTSTQVNDIDISLSGRYTIAACGEYLYYFDILKKCDLELSKITLPVGNWGEGDNRSIEIEVSNNGPFQSPATTFSVLNDTGSIINSLNISSIETWESITIQVPYTCKFGENKITFYIDYDSKIFDTNRNNNFDSCKFSALSKPCIIKIDTIYFEEDQTFSGLDLDNYAIDSKYSPKDLIFSITNMTHLTAEINATTHNLTIIPEPDWFGIEELILIVKNPDNITNSTNLVVNITPINDYPNLNLINPTQNASISGKIKISGIADDVDGEKLIIEIRINNELITSFKDVFGDFDYTWDTSTVSNGPHEIKTKVSDAILYSEVSINVIIINSYKINSITANINDGAKDVQIDTEIIITFPEKINETTLKITVIDSKSKKIEGIIDYDENYKRVKFSPLNNYDFNSSYTITVKVGLKDIYGASIINNDYIIRFTTIPTKADSLKKEDDKGGAGDNNLWIIIIVVIIVVVILILLAIIPKKPAEEMPPPGEDMVPPLKEIPPEGMPPAEASPPAICATCGSEIPMGSPTCVACGAPAPPPPVSLEGMPLADIAPPMGFTNCSQCGKQLTVSTTSCPKCGAEFEEEYEEEPKEELKDEKEFEVEEGLEEDLMIEEPFEKEIEEKKKIDIKRTYSVIGDNIKYGVKVINKYNYTINNINIRINYPKDALDLMKPENGMLHISYINPGDSQSGNFFMKPLYCVKTKLSGVIDYLDPKGNFQVEKIKPLKTNLICPFIQPKKISEGEYVSFTKGMHSTSKGFSVKKGISLQFILNMCMNHCNYLYHVKKQDNKNEDGEIVSIIMYLSGESKVQELNYLLTIIINKNPSINGADIAFSAYCSSKEGLAGFIKEVIETLKYTILAEKDAHEVVMISNKQVINIIDSVVMRSKIGDNRVISSI